MKPREASQYTFESGADYICAGMYVFQIVEDANIALETTQRRQRSWLAWEAWRGRRLVSKRVVS